MHPVGTKENTADIGTKPLSGKRIKLLLHWLGFQDENNEPVGSEELQEHRSQEQAKASVRMIKSKGNFAFAALLFSAIFRNFRRSFHRKDFRNSAVKSRNRHVSGPHEC